ncbi:SAF domain-containing protein, partial [Georgenia yuyongxinii]
MKRRLLAAVAALVLAITGAVLLLGYVAGADARAQAGMAPATVLVATEPIPQGTAAADVAALVTAREIPAVAVVPGALASLDDVAGLVTTADVHPGEQLHAGRFADADVAVATGRIEIPADLHQVSVLLDPQRVVGGRLVAGDTVAVFVSLRDPARTHAVLHKVLVANVQGGVAAPARDGVAAASGAADGVAASGAAADQEAP